MRLKQLLGTLLSLFIASAMAAAAGTQLTAVRIVPQGNATTVTLRATGAFTHTEYRPMDDLLLVDLAGVSAPRFEGAAHPLTSGAVVSYRVLGYQGASGGHVSRVELGLAPGASFKLTEGVHELRLLVTEASSAATASPATAKSYESAHAPAGPQVGTHPAQIRNIAVARGKDGMEVEILSNAALQPKALKLAGPDRVVVDLPNALAASRLKMISVNAGDVKSVRMGLYQVTPPVTRVVIDLLANRDYELVQSANKLTVRLHPMGVSASTHSELSIIAGKTTEPSVAASAAVTSAAATVVPANLPAKATDLAMVQVQLQPVQPVKDPAAKAVDAATKFGPDKKDTAFDVAPTASAAMLPASYTGMALQTQGAVPAPTPAPALTVPAAKPKYTGEPISVNLKDVDLKDFFRLIHEISGLNVVLDPAVHGSLTIVLDDVPWDQALDIVLKNNGLDRQLEGNVLRIATVETLRKEADARRGQIEAQALAVDKVTVTRFLSYAHSKDVVPTVKKFLSQRGDVVSDDRTNALIIDDIPNVIPKIDELLVKLDRKTAEVEIEARVVAATRNFARDIGTQLGFGIGINDGTSTAGGLSQVGQTNTIANPAGPAGACCFFPTNGGTIPLFSNFPAVGPTSGLTFVNASEHFRLDFQLSLAESRGLLKILSRPRVVTQNNIQAVVRQGVKVPIVTLAQLGGPPTVTYVDAFLRLSVTPQITVENTIFLNVDVENTTPDFSRQVNGNPTLLTSQATTQVLVTDGGTVVIGGVIQTNNAVSILQVPLLGNIPVLGNLFKRRSVSTQTQELIFFITPKIVQT
jgi:type IV pilus assembly protein PilQ